MSYVFKAQDTLQPHWPAGTTATWVHDLQKKKKKHQWEANPKQYPNQWQSVFSYPSLNLGFSVWKAKNLANLAMSQPAQTLCLLCHENEQHIFNVK